MSRFGDLTIEDCRRKCTDVRSSTACLYDARKRVCTTGWDAQQCNPQPPTSEEDYRYYAGFCREECSPASNPSRRASLPMSQSSQDNHHLHHLMSTSSPTVSTPAFFYEAKEQADLLKGDQAKAAIAKVKKAEQAAAAKLKAMKAQQQKAKELFKQAASLAKKQQVRARARACVHACVRARVRALLGPPQEQL